MQSFASRFDVGLLARPAKKKAFVLQSRWQAPQFHYFLRRKIALGDLLTGEIRPDQLYIHAYLPPKGKRKQCHAVRMRDIKLNFLRRRFGPQSWFALGAVVKCKVSWDSVQVPPKQFAKNSTGRNKAVAVRLKNETLRPGFLIRRERGFESAQDRVAAIEISAPNVNFVSV